MAGGVPSRGKKGDFTFLARSGRQGEEERRRRKTRHGYHGPSKISEEKKGKKRKATVKGIDGSRDFRSSLRCRRAGRMGYPWENAIADV